MSKTTAEKVIDGLECKGTTGSNCKECQFRGNGEDCSVLAMQAAADLIKSQEKRIKELETVVEKGRWHDLEKNPEDTPEDEQDVLCLVEYTRYGDRPGKAKRMDVGYYIKGRWGGPAIQGQSARICKWRKVEYEEVEE